MTYRYAFTGDPTRGGDGPAEIVWFGVRFPKGVPVEVDAELAARLNRHNHWTRVDGAPVDDDEPEPVFEIAPVEPIHKKRGRPRKA